MSTIGGGLLSLLVFEVERGLFVEDGASQRQHDTTGGYNS